MPARPRRTSSRAAFVPALLAVAGTAGGEPGDAAVPPHPYVGTWVTDDGRIRHELLPDGRYDEARGDRRSAYRGRYTIAGNRIDYVDDTGFTADGEFVDGVLYHAGMVLRREAPAPLPADDGA